MDLRGAKTNRSAMPSTRVLALLAFVMAACLGGWRASESFTQPDTEWVPASAMEASLMGILEPLAGKGNIRLSITDNGGTGRTIFVLLSEEAANAAPTIERVTQSVTMLEPAAGDQLVIEEAAFARGVPGRPSAETWTELGLFGGLCLLLAWIGLAPGSEKPAAPVHSEARPPVPLKSVPVSESVTPQRPRRIAQAEPETAADIARKDPAKAASILRTWMQGEEGAA